MIRLHLEEQERMILLQLLDTCISDLRVEITDTDNINDKDMLEERKQVLVKLQQSFLIEQETLSTT